MPDPIVMVLAVVGAATIAGVVLLVYSWLGRSPEAPRVAGGWALGQGVGFLTGCWVLGIRPHWPIKEDLDRLLAVVIPAVTVVELLATSRKLPAWLVWVLRVVVAAGTARVLLHGSSYLANRTAANSAAWSPTATWLILVGLAGGLGIVWLLVTRLAHQVPGVSVPLSLAVTCAGAALTVMFSGYATGGQLGLPLAGAVLGSVAASYLLPRWLQLTRPLGVDVVGLFSLLVIGRFFGELTSLHFVLLLCAPLLGWLPDAPHVRRLHPWLRSLLRVLLVGFVVSGVVVAAQRRFVEQFQSASSPAGNEPTVDDYMNYGR